MIFPFVVALVVLAADSAPASPAPEKIAVLPLARKRVAKEAAEILDELVLASIGKYPKYRAIGRSDFDAILGLEKMKDTLGCSEVACAVELGGALGVNLILSGTVSRLGTNVLIT